MNGIKRPWIPLAPGYRLGSKRNREPMRAPGLDSKSCDRYLDFLRRMSATAPRARTDIEAGSGTMS